eukprot:5915348-Prymnesium_polylepis.1
MAKRDRHDAMTDPRALHVVGGSKSNAKISKFLLFYAELRNLPTVEFGPGTPGTLPGVGMWGNLQCLDVHEQVSHARPDGHGPDVQLGRGNPLPRPATSRLSGENVKTWHHGRV